MRTVRLFVSILLTISFIYEVNGIPRFLETLRKSERILAANWRNVIHGKDPSNDLISVSTQAYGEGNHFSDSSKIDQEFLNLLSGMLDDRFENSFKSQSESETIIKAALDQLKQMERALELDEAHESDFFEN